MRFRIEFVQAGLILLGVIFFGVLIFGSGSLKTFFEDRFGVIFLGGTACFIIANIVFLFTVPEEHRARNAKLVALLDNKGGK